jgi:hypothetical protein
VVAVIVVLLVPQTLVAVVAVLQLLLVQVRLVVQELCS